MSDVTIPTPYPPSPVAPWQRPAVSPVAQTLAGDGTASLSAVMTYLDSTTPKDAEDESVPYVVALPDGNHKQQMKNFQIPSASIENSARWRVEGNFAGFIALELDSLGQQAVLSWDGAAWHLIGGSATKSEA